MKKQMQRYGWMAVVMSLVTAGAALGAPATAMTFKATASVKAPGKSASVPVTITVDKFVSDADRDKVVAAVKGGTAQKALGTAVPDPVLTGERDCSGSLVPGRPVRS